MIFGHTATLLALTIMLGALDHMRGVQARKESVPVLWQGEAVLPMARRCYIRSSVLSRCSAQPKLSFCRASAGRAVHPTHAVQILGNPLTQNIHTIIKQSY